MNIENIKRLVREFRNENYRDLVGALIIYEQLGYFANEEINELDEKDTEFLEKIFDDWLHSDEPGILNEYITNDIEERESEEE